MPISSKRYSFLAQREHICTLQVFPRQLFIVLRQNTSYIENNSYGAGYFYSAYSPLVDNLAKITLYN